MKEFFKYIFFALLKSVGIKNSYIPYEYGHIDGYDKVICRRHKIFKNKVQLLMKEADVYWLLDLWVDVRKDKKKDFIINK